MATKKTATTVKKLYVLVDDDGDPMEIGTLSDLAGRIDSWYDGDDDDDYCNYEKDFKIYELGSEKKFTYVKPIPGTIKLK